MAIDIELPSYSPSMEEADLIGWLVAPGDYVNEGDPIAEIETDKATGELEAPASGTLIEICVPEGTTGVKVGTVVARLEGAAASATAASFEAEPVQPAREAEPAETEPPIEVVVEKVRAESAGPAPTALARRRAAQTGVSLEAVSGSGSHGRITRADVEAAARPGAGTALAVLDVECAVVEALAVCEHATTAEPDLAIDLGIFALRAAVLALVEVPEVRAGAAPGAEPVIEVHAPGDTPVAFSGVEHMSLAVLARERLAGGDAAAGLADLALYDFGARGIHRVEMPPPASVPLALGCGAARAEATATFTLCFDPARVDVDGATRFLAAFARRISEPLEMLL